MNSTRKASFFLPFSGQEMTADEMFLVGQELEKIVCSIKRAALEQGATKTETPDELRLFPAVANLGFYPETGTITLKARSRILVRKRELRKATGR